MYTFNSTYINYNAFIHLPVWLKTDLWHTNDQICRLVHEPSLHEVGRASSTHIPSFDDSSAAGVGEGLLSSILGWHGVMDSK